MLTATPPERSDAQRHDALAKANHVRSYRKQLKIDLKAGRRRFGDVLRTIPEEVETMKVMDLMVHIPRIGRVKATRVFRDLDMSPSKTIGGLSQRQRSALITTMKGR